MLYGMSRIVLVVLGVTASGVAAYAVIAFSAPPSGALLSTHVVRPSG